MLLKAGTYKWNNDLISAYFELTPDNFADYLSNQHYSMTVVDFVSNGASYVDIHFMHINAGTYSMNGNSFEYPDAYILSYYDSEGNETAVRNDLDSGEWNVDVQTLTFNTDVEVSDEFGTVFIANTNYNEVNTPQEDTTYLEKSSWYTSVANAIRSKKGTSEPINRDNFASEISSITGGGETPYYDGTVIIEKAESGLGLRRWKETITPIATVNANEDDVMPVKEIISQYGFEIKNPDVSNVTLSCLIDGFNGETHVEGFGYYEPTGHESTHYLWLGKDMIIESLPEFEVGSTANSTVDEWLLANTEGVSV